MYMKVYIHEHIFQLAVKIEKKYNCKICVVGGDNKEGSSNINVAKNKTYIINMI